LLILAGEIVLAGGAVDTLESVERLARRVQRIALSTPEPLWSPDRLDFVLLVGFR
jgi:hypothetical protein